MISKYTKKFFSSNENYLGQRFFYAGTFFLGSALPISIIFFLITICFSINIKRFKILKDKYSLALLISLGIMIFSSLNSTIILNEDNNINSINVWINLFNWAPLFILFSCSDIYLDTPDKRKNFSKFLIAGTFPILLSCILESWFNINGIFRTFNGFIVWYMEKVGSPDESISGLFSNRNYTGIWLSCVLSFSTYELFNTGKNIYKKILILAINILLLYFAIFTFSRNTIIGIIISYVFIFKKYKLLISIISSYTIINIIWNTTSNFLYDSKIFGRLLISNLENFWNFNRVEIFTIAAKLISENPILGWGASTFPIMYKVEGGLQSAQHAHNIILELAFNYGLPLSLLLSGFVFVLLLRSFKLLDKKNTYYSEFLIDRCWLSASIVVVVSHLFDITYFDGRISILIWILLAGLKSIINENLSGSSKEELIV